MKTSLIRSIELLRHLPRVPRRIDAGALEGRLRSLGFETTRRMVQRDLVALAEHFPIDCRENEKPFGWGWAPGSAPPVVPVMDVPTALVFRLVELHLAGVLPPAVRAVLSPQFEAAQRVLRMVDPDGGLADRVRLIPAGFAARPPSLDEDVLSAVTEALAQRLVLEAEYTARGQPGPKAYRLHPLGLVVRGHTLTLVASVQGVRALGRPRSFVLHRFESARLGDVAAESPPGFRLDEHIAEGGLNVRFGKGPIPLVLRVDAKAAPAVREGIFGDDQVVEELADGRVELRVSVPDSQALRAWVLGFGDLAEVIGPAKLRAWFRGVAEGMGRLYAE